MARTSILRKVYNYGDGEKGRSAKPSATHLNFEFVAPKKDKDDKLVVLETRTIDLNAFQAEHTEDGMFFCAAGHGLSQKFGDELANLAKKAEAANFSEDAERGFVDFAVTLWDDLFDNINAGVWVQEGEGSSGGQNVTILVEAILRAFKDAGKEFDEAEQKAKLLAKVRDEKEGENYRNSARKNPQVAMHIANINAERAQERARKAAEAAAKAAEGGETEGMSLDEM